MRKPRVLLDVDGVLADFLSFSIQTIYDLSEQTYTPDQFTEWDLFKTFDPKWKHEFYFECSKPGVASYLKVYEGACQGVAHLKEISDVYVVTAPMRNSLFWYKDRQIWLDKNFGIPHHRLVYTEAKHLCRGDVLVDDKPENVREWSKENPDGIGLLWDAPYNRLERGFTRASSWEDVASVVRLQAERIERGLLG